MARVKFNFGKVVGLSVLVIAMAVGVALTQQNQDFREKAYVPKVIKTSSPTPTLQVRPTSTPRNLRQPIGTPLRSY